MPRYEFVGGKSSKFWEAEVDGTELTTRWGRIGTNGQTKTKTYDSTDAAEAERDKQAAAKVKKGYELIGDAEPAEDTEPAKKPAKKKPAEPAPPEPDDGKVWVDTGVGYSLALDGAKLVCRNAKGKQLASVPKKARDSEVAEELKALAAWLATHERECAETIEGWMLRSLPVPRAVLASTWPDPAWQGPLTNAVVAPVDGDGKLDQDSAGLLRGMDPQKGVGVVDLDGETTWLDPGALAIPHPILLEELTDWRELATELSMEQGISQLFRETWARPDDADPDETSVAEFSGGKFEMLLHAIGRAKTLGYRVRGGFSVCPVWEEGRMVEARYWIGSDYPESETYTGELLWVDDRERAIKLGDVGPTAYSEGMRMASVIYAGRVVEKEDE